MTHKSLWLLTAAVFIVLLLPALVQQGMFLDGVTNACVAKNMAKGLGNFSKPYYTPALDPVFFGQPPLALWLQSLYFKMFGDHFWVERLYAFCAAVLSALGIVMNGRALRNEGSIQETPDFLQHSWLPVLLWITMPVAHWSYQNNMLECSMSVFVLLAAYFASKSVFEKKEILLTTAALFTAAAVLCKGPVGFFPIAVPLAAWLAFRPIPFAAAIARTAILFLLALALLALVIGFVPGMPQYWDLYLNKQLLPTLSGAHQMQAGGHLKILSDLAAQYAVPAVLLVLISVRRGFRSIKTSKPAVFFFLLGLAGSLPLLLSPKQSAHYLVPSLPFYALGFAAILNDNFQWGKAAAANGKGAFEKLAWLVLLASFMVSLSFFGKYRRDEQTIQDVRAICARAGDGATLSVPPPMAEDWLLIAYMGRLGNVGLASGMGHHFCLTEKGAPSPQGYQKTALILSKYALWVKN